MRLTNYSQLQTAAALVCTHARGELARLTRLADGHRSELDRLEHACCDEKFSGNLSAEETFRCWCRRQIEIETAALRDVERAIRSQRAVVAKASARELALASIEAASRRERLRARIRRDLEVN